MSVKDALANSFFRKFVLTLSLLGFSLSLLAAFFSGASFATILLRMFISSLALALLGASVFFLFDALIPEWRELWADNEIKNETSLRADEFSERNQETFLPDFNSSDEISKESLLYRDDEFSSQHFPSKGAIQSAKKNKKVADDEILVEGIPIKKDPHIMSEAIRQVLDQDD